MNETAEEAVAQDFCPVCRQLRALDVTTSTHVEEGPDGEEQRVQLLSFHCSD